MILFEPLHILLNAIPKTGRTTWKFLLWLYRNQSKSDSVMLEDRNLNALLEIYRKIPGDRLEFFRSLHFLDDLEMILKQYYSVLTVRHPFVRLESAYLDKFHNSKENREFYYIKYGALMFSRYRNLTLTRRELTAADRPMVTFEVKWISRIPMNTGRHIHDWPVPAQFITSKVEPQLSSPLFTSSHYK